MLELVSVVVPIFKVEKYLNQCVESILGQTYSNLEIILVDDGSPDNCAFLCDEWIGKDNRIQVIHKPNGGLSDARNKGLGIVTGEYIAFIDSDDWIEPDFVEKMINVAKKEDADVVACSYINEYESTGVSECAAKEYFSGDSEQALSLIYDQTRILPAAMKFYKSQIWKELRFPFGKLYEDTLTTYKVFHMAKRIVQIPDELYHYRIRENSIMTQKFSLKNVGISDAWKENYLFCKENYPRIADLARSFWLEHIPNIISQFPKKTKREEKIEKDRLKKEILDNLLFSITHMSIKKLYWQIRALTK